MPYLRITCPKISSEKKRIIDRRLTEWINDLFFHPRARITREELRERTTVHFTPYLDGNFFIGARTPSERCAQDVTIVLSDWNMTVRQQRKVAGVLTEVVAELFEIPLDQQNNINVRFHPYSPTDFAVGGRLLSDIIPLIGRTMKRLFG